MSFEWRSKKTKSKIQASQADPKHQHAFNQPNTPIDHICLIAFSPPHFPPNNLSYLTSLKFANLPLAFAFQLRAASSFF
jgi:hypothetical protein